MYLTSVSDVPFLNILSLDDSPLKKNQIFLDLSLEFGDRQIYKPSVFNRFKINPLTVMIVRWTPGKNNVHISISSSSFLQLIIISIANSE